MPTGRHVDAPRRRPPGLRIAPRALYAAECSTFADGDLGKYGPTDGPLPHADLGTIAHVSATARTTPADDLAKPTRDVTA